MSQIVYFLSYIIPFLIVLTVVVFIHELGHYLVAKRNGVKIEVFSIGFGPEVFGWNDAAGTRWKVSLVPVGGYVKMLGDADASSKPDGELVATLSEEEKQKTLQAKTIPQRIAVVAAGPIANYLLAAVLMAGLFMIKGEPVTTTVVGEIMEHSAAHNLGIQKGDKIVEVNDVKMNNLKELMQSYAQLAGKDVKFVIERVNTPSHLIIKGKMLKNDPKTGEKIPTAQLGIKPGPLAFTPLSPIQAVAASFTTIWDMSIGALESFGQMLRGQRSAGELGGILAIGEMAGKSAQEGVGALIWFIAILSVNLGLLNLLPIPVLDGGHILLYSIEGIRGKPVSPKIQEYVFLAGLVFVMSIMLFSTWNDLSRLKVFSWFGIGN